MARAIQVVEVRTYHYTPDLSGDSYVAEECLTVEEALAIDKRDVESGDFSLDEIADKDPVTTYTWSIVDE